MIETSDWWKSHLRHPWCVHFVLTYLNPGHSQCRLSCQRVQWLHKPTAWSRVQQHSIRKNGHVCAYTGADKLSADNKVQTCANKLVCLHMCADNVRTKYFFCTCVRTNCRQTADKARQTADKLQTKPDKLQTNCRQCQTNLSAVCLALSAVCPHTCADTQIYLQIVCTTLSAHMCRQTSLSPHCLHTCADKLVCPQLIQEHTGSLQLLFCTCGPDKNRANLVCKKKHFDVYICIALYSYLWHLSDFFPSRRVHTHPFFSLSPNFESNRRTHCVEVTQTSWQTSASKTQKLSVMFNELELTTQVSAGLVHRLKKTFLN
jgi:hypothetical protein